MGDPYTGLAWPQRIATAEVTAQTGLPVSASLPWVTLKTADTIPVPPDTWVDWDAKAQKFITAAEKFPNGTTAKVKSVVTYPADLFTTVKWHDGSPLSVADFIMPTIQFFDEANKDSKIYDPALEPYVQSVLTYYKGFRITSTNPLTIEAYSDLVLQRCGTGCGHRLAHFSCRPYRVKTAGMYWLYPTWPLPQVNSLIRPIRQMPRRSSR